MGARQEHVAQRPGTAGGVRREWGGAPKSQDEPFPAWKLPWNFAGVLEAHTAHLANPRYQSHGAPRNVRASGSFLSPRPAAPIRLQGHLWTGAQRSHFPQI